MRQNAVKQSADWEVSTASQWAMALLLNQADPSAAFALHRSEPQGTRAYASGAPRLWLSAQARRVLAWNATDDGKRAGPLPASPACGGARATGGSECGPLEEVRLVPLGNTRLRIGILPYTWE